MYLSDTQPQKSMQLVINTSYWAQPAKHLYLGVFSSDEI
jgi:hypothetical protein